MENFKVLDVFKWAKADLKKNFWGIALAFVVVFFISTFLNGGNANQEHVAVISSFKSIFLNPFFILSSLINFYFMAGIMKELLRIVNTDKKFDFMRVLKWPNNLNHFLTYLYYYLIFLFFAAILVGGAYVIGLGKSIIGLAIILLGLIAFLIFVVYTLFTPYLILEDRVKTVSEGIKKSKRILKGNGGKIFIWFLWAILFSFLVGILTGILAIIPFIGIVVYIILMALIEALIIISFIHLYRVLDPEVEKSFLKEKIEAEKKDEPKAYNIEKK